MWEAPVKVQRTSVGLDVHARSVVACGLDGDTGEVFERRLTPDLGEIVAWLGDLPGPVAVTYEAGPTGFGLARGLNTAGIRCAVAHRRSCSARLGIESRPMRVMPAISPGCCIWARSWRCRFPVLSRKPLGICFGHARIAARM